MQFWICAHAELQSCFLYWKLNFFLLIEKINNNRVSPGCLWVLTLFIILCWFPIEFWGIILLGMFLFMLGSGVILGSFSWGVADIILAGMEGMGWLVAGLLANREANILFLSQSLLPVLSVEETPSFDLFDGLSSPRSSPGRFLEFGGEGQLVKPKLASRESSWDCWFSGFRSSSFSFRSWWRSSLCFLIPARASKSSSSLLSFSNWELKKN